MTSAENFSLLLEELAKLLNIGALRPDEDGIVVLEIDNSIPLYLQYAAGRESLVLACEIAQLPKDTPASMFRRLLGAQLFDQGTGGGKFAMDNESDTLVFSFERVLDGIPFALFREILENFIRTCEFWRGEITIAANGESGSAGGSGLPFPGLPGIRV